VDYQQEKKQVRKELLNKRQNIPDEMYRQHSKMIAKLLLGQVEYKKARNIHCYVSMNDRKEVDTHLLLRHMLSSGKNVIVPVMHMDDVSLTHIQISRMNDLSPNDWGVPEPTIGRRVRVSEIDLVIVPMLGGDLQKNRIGYGKGFYDRFLSRVDCPKIGLTFDLGIVENGIPVEEYDVSLDKIITEKRVVE